MYLCAGETLSFFCRVQGKAPPGISLLVSLRFLLLALLICPSLYLLILSTRSCGLSFHDILPLSFRLHSSSFASCPLHENPNFPISLFSLSLSLSPPPKKEAGSRLLCNVRKIQLHCHRRSRKIRYYNRQYGPFQIANRFTMRQRSLHARRSA